MAKRRKKRLVRAQVPKRVAPKGFPTLADLEVPKGGLLAPKLRSGVTGKIPTAKEIFGR